MYIYCRKSPFFDAEITPIFIFKTVNLPQFKMGFMKRENFRLYEDIFNLLT